MDKPLLTLKPFVLVDTFGKEIVNPKSKGIKTYITARSFRNAMQESGLPKEFVDWFIKDPYNGRARFVTHYKKELYESYKIGADYISYKDPAFKALEQAGLCDRSCLSEMDTSGEIKAKQYLLLMAAEVEANFVKYLFSQKYPGEYLSVNIEPAQLVVVSGAVSFLNPVKTTSKAFGNKLF